MLGDGLVDVAAIAKFYRVLVATGCM